MFKTPVVELQSHEGEASDEAGLESEVAAVVSSLFLLAAGAAVEASSDTAGAASELESAGGHTHSEAAEDSVEAASDAPASDAAASGY